MRIGFTERGIAIFALIGAAGALWRLIAGRLADRDFGRIGTALSRALIIACFTLSAWGAFLHCVASPAAAGVALDFSAQSNNVFGRRAPYLLAPELGARLNHVYVAIFFLGGTPGSAVAGVLLTEDGGAPVAAAGGGAPGLAPLSFLGHETLGRPLPANAK